MYSVQLNQCVSKSNAPITLLWKYIVFKLKATSTTNRPHVYFKVSMMGWTCLIKIGLFHIFKHERPETWIWSVANNYTIVCLFYSAIFLHGFTQRKTLLDSKIIRSDHQDPIVQYHKVCTRQDGQMIYTTFQYAHLHSNQIWQARKSYKFIFRLTS